MIACACSVVQARLSGCGSAFSLSRANRRHPHCGPVEPTRRRQRPCTVKVLLHQLYEYPVSNGRSKLRLHLHLHVTAVNCPAIHGQRRLSRSLAENGPCYGPFIANGTWLTIRIRIFSTKCHLPARPLMRGSSLSITDPLSIPDSAPRREMRWLFSGSGPSQYHCCAGRETIETWLDHCCSEL